MALRERAMLRRLQIGLADEGADVIHVVPTSAIARVPHGMFARLVSFDDRPSMFRSVSQTMLAEQIKPMVNADSKLVVHVFGMGLLSVAFYLAEYFHCSVAIEVNSPASAQRVVASRATAMPPDAVALLTPDPALQRRLIARLASSRKPDIASRCVPWGVLCPPEIHPIFDEQRTPTLLVGGSGQHRQAYVALIEACAAVAADGAEFLVLIDADAAERASIGPVIARLGLADRFSQVPNIDVDRLPGLQADAIIVPEAIGEHRSIVLDAMASGVLVLAHEDPLVSMLRDGYTALCVRHDSTNAWRILLAEVLANPTRARSIARNARDYVAHEHKASTHTAGILDTYEWLTSSGSLKITAKE